MPYLLRAGRGTSTSGRNTGPQRRRARTPAVYLLGHTFTAGRAGAFTPIPQPVFQGPTFTASAGMSGYYSNGTNDNTIEVELNWTGVPR